jgi:GH24 family phage-related lysozyme (muramidase)
VNNHLKTGLSQYMFDALTSVAFNSQRAALSLIRQYDNVRGPLFTSDFVETLPRGWLSPPGMINRRVDEADLFFLGRY